MAAPGPAADAPPARAPEGEGFCQLYRSYVVSRLREAGLRPRRVGGALWAGNLWAAAGGVPRTDRLLVLAAGRSGALTAGVLRSLAGERGARRVPVACVASAGPLAPELARVASALGIRTWVLPVDGSGPAWRVSGRAHRVRAAALACLALAACLVPGARDRSRPAALAAPAGLRAASVAATAVRLAWQPVPGAAGYRLYWGASPAAGPAGGAASVTTAEPSARIAGLGAGTDYSFVVQAWGPAGAGPPSPVLRVETALTWQSVFEAAQNSVVLISGYGPASAPPLEEPCGGTAFFVTARDLLAASHSVLCAYRSFEASVPAGPGGPAQTEAVTVVATDVRDDLALLALAPGDPSGAPLPLDPQPVAGGTAVAVVGDAAGLTPARYSTGRVVAFVSGLQVAGRSAPVPEAIQITAAAMGGDSGSPVLNPYGQVVGVVESGSASYENDVYAVPIGAAAALIGTA